LPLQWFLFQISHCEANDSKSSETRHRDAEAQTRLSSQRRFAQEGRELDFGAMNLSLDNSAN